MAANVNLTMRDARVILKLENEQLTQYGIFEGGIYQKQ